MAGKWLAALALLVLPGSAVAAEDPLRLYGNDAVFEIFRNGSQVGQQSVTFERRADGALVAREASEIAVRILGIAVYRFRYDGVSVWRDGQLEALEAVTNDDGTINKVVVREGGAGTVVEATTGRAEAPQRLLAVAHWNTDVLTKTDLVNSIKGKIEKVSITMEGTDPIAVPGGQVMARRYVYRGDLDLTVWYDDAARWVALRFAARDGSTIDYRCKRCGAHR
jgi:hypothetical protein